MSHYHPSDNDAGWTSIQHHSRRGTESGESWHESKQADVGFPLIWSPITASIATLLQQVRYEIVICSEMWDIRALLFVGLLSGNWPEMLGANNFHPASNHYSTHWKLTHSSTSNAVVPLYPNFWIFLNIYLHQNIAILSLIINNRVKFLAARSYIGYWVVFHPASLSEGWLCAAFGKL